MFKPNSVKDRINYGEVLLPPAGYHLERAIGTTYSLDLETLTAISISLGLMEDTDSELLNNPIGMLNALQKVSNRITVFCEAGQIKLPSKPNALCLMLEKMVVPITLPYNKEIGRYPAFHPKTWVLEYVDHEGSKKYRFVILSRNLTFDHSWDIACSLDGEVVSGGRIDSPIVDFLNFLKKHLNRELANYQRQNEDVTYLIDTMKHVEFYVDDRFSECYILPMGIGKNEHKMTENELFSENFHELVVMSPFLTGSVMETLNSDGKSLTGTKRTLITRRTELSKIANGEVSNFDVYVMKDDIVDGAGVDSEDESTIEEGRPSSQEDDADSSKDDVLKQDIHAKMYIRRKNNVVDMYMGSMNASYAAIHANVEMMLWLRTKKNVISGEKFLDDIMGEDREGRKNPFVLVNPEKTEQDDSRPKDAVEQLIKRVCRLKMTALSTAIDEEHYRLVITVDTDRMMRNVIIRPLRSKKEACLSSCIEVAGLKKLELSEFYVVSASIDDCTLERVIMIPTAGLPEERDAEIIKSVIKDKRSFIEYVSFILGEDYVQSFLENKKTIGEYAEWDAGRYFPAVYEKMLKTSVSDPERLKEIQYITSAIKEENIIPKEFSDMYRVFCETLKI